MPFIQPSAIAPSARIPEGEVNRCLYDDDDHEVYEDDNRRGEEKEKITRKDEERILSGVHLNLLYNSFKPTL